MESASSSPMPHAVESCDTTTRHKTHSTELEVYYPWHPWFGLKVTTNRPFTRRGVARVYATLEHEGRPRFPSLPRPYSTLLQPGSQCDARQDERRTRVRIWPRRPSIQGISRRVGLPTLNAHFEWLCCKNSLTILNRNRQHGDRRSRQDSQD